MISVVCAHYDQVDERSLKPLEAIWKLKGAWFRAEPGRRPSDYDLRGPRVSGPVGDSGVLISKADYLTVEDLTCEGFANDGFNVHGSCHGLVFRNVTARWNGDDGFSVHEDVQATVFNLHSHHNDFGIQDIGASQTSFFGCLIETNRLCGIDLYSGMRIVYDTVVRGNGGGQIRLNPGMGKTMGFEPENPMLVLQAYLKRVRVDGGEGAGLAVGKDCRVCAADCRVSGTDVGVRVDGGDLHWVGGTVAGCRRELDVGKARSFVTDGPRGGSRSD